MPEAPASDVVNLTVDHQPLVVSRRVLRNLRESEPTGKYSFDLEFDILNLSGGLFVSTNGPFQRSPRAGPGRKIFIPK